MVVELAICAVLAVQVGGTLAPEPPRHGLQLGGEAAEAFLRSADVVDREHIPVGVSNPEQVTLTDGTQTQRAVFKTIDEFKMKKTLGRQNRPERNFRDSYKHEIAAYELDKLLGLGMVPPTVERRIGVDRGSLQLWVESAESEFDRRTSGRDPPDQDAWNHQIHNVRLFHQLTSNTDYANLRNLLVDPDFKVYIIDASRCFRFQHDLREEGALTRFDRRVLESLRTLTFELLRERMGRWLSAEQIRALLARRDVILARADRLVAEKGEPAVLFP